MTPSTTSDYSDTCYRSDSATRMPSAQFICDRNHNGIFTTHLAHGSYAHLEPVSIISAQLEDEQHRHDDHRENAIPSSEAACNAKRWKLNDTSVTAGLLIALRIMCFPTGWIVWSAGFLPSLSTEVESELAHKIIASSAPVMSLTIVTSLFLFVIYHKAAHCLQLSAIAVCTFLLFHFKGTLLGSTELHISYWGSVFVYLMGTVGCDGMLWLRNLCSPHESGEFNRADGMVRFRRRLRRPFVAPFEEFDAVLEVAPINYGFPLHSIVLRHRYTGNSISLAGKMHHIEIDRVNALAFWDCLQRYMDVTQPLPDLPVLERSRHLDPVTAQYDSRTGRPERRWRNQAVTGWKTGGERRLRAQLERYPWQQHACIIQARLSDTIRIQDYYRALEAAGVEITPDSQDYQCLRLPERG
ncbi:hypothetical protein [Pseudomonas sp. v388]|uniref:hypothetical protein n=1 Tax=Pseudomonas sp. v388 TaxID=2479849 RepID=UPI002114B86A|nr:hypothetical protein [Pseudomonas sp. v388]